MAVLAIHFKPREAWAGRRLTIGQRAKEVRRQMLRRGSGPGEISLALAGLYARGKDQRRVYFHINRARKQGIPAARTELLLGAFFRRVERFDAAFSTLVRILVRHQEQPFALVELWRTLYQCKLQGAEVKTDTGAIRERLVSSGLYFPRNFRLARGGITRSKELSAVGYNNLLAGQNRFAAELFEAALDKNPSNAQAHRGLGIARARTQDYLRAAGAYLVYQSLKPNALDAEAVDRILMEYWKSRYTNN